MVLRIFGVMFVAALLPFDDCLPPTGLQKVGNVALGVHKGDEILSCQMKIVITVC